MRFWENRKLAWGVLALSVAASLFFGGGGALIDKRDDVNAMYTANSQSITAELAELRQNADTLLSIAREYDEANQAYIDALSDALAALQASDVPADQYKASVALSSAVEHCYSNLSGLSLSAADSEDVRYKYKNFTSALLRISHDPYNEAAEAFNQELSRFPANVIGRMRGVKPVSLFR